MQSFKEYLQVKGLNHKTVSQYLYYLRLFGDPIPFTQSRVNAFVIERHNSVPIRAFINNLRMYLLGEGHSVEKVQLSKMTGAKKKTVLNIVDEEGIKSIASNMSERNRLMLYYQFYCGLRSSELVGDGADIPGIRIFDFDLDWNDISEKVNKGTEIGTVRLKVIGKRNKERYVFVREWLLKSTYEWLLSHPIGGDPDENVRIFKISVRRWEIILKKAGQKALKRDIYPHLLRHSMGSHLYESGWDMRKIADYLGHDSLDTVNRYIHTTENYLKEEFDRVVR